MLNFETTQNFINSRVTTSTSPVNQIIETYGYYSLGGLGAAKWRSTGNVITPSQDPLALNDIKLSDASGNEYELVVNSAGVIDLNVLGGTSAGYVSIAEAAGLVYSQNLGSGGGVGNIVKETIIATDGQTLFNTIGNYNLGGNNLNVYINGVRQDAASYSETSISSFTLNEPSSAGDEVEYIINEVPSITSEGISVIDTVNTLSNLSGVLTGQVFMVEERANALFEAKTGLTANGFDILQSLTDGSIQYELRLNNYIFLSQLGAMFDWNGTTGTDNTEVVRRAHALRESTGLEVVTPPGIGRITDTITASGNSFAFIGNIQNNTFEDESMFIFNPSGSQTVMFECLQPSPVFRDVGFNSDDRFAGYDLVSLSNVDIENKQDVDATFERCLFVNYENAVSMLGRGCRFISCEFSSGRNALKIDWPNPFSPPGLPEQSLYMGMRGYTFEDCDIHASNGYAIVNTGYNADNANNIHFVGGNFDSSVGVLEGSARDSVFSGINITQGEIEIFDVGTGKLENVVVDGCNFMGMNPSSGLARGLNGVVVALAGSTIRNVSFNGVNLAEVDRTCFFMAGDVDGFSVTGGTTSRFMLDNQASAADRRWIDISSATSVKNVHLSGVTLDNDAWANNPTELIKTASGNLDNIRVGTVVWDDSIIALLPEDLKGTSYNIHTFAYAGDGADPNTVYSGNRTIQSATISWRSGGSPTRTCTTATGSGSGSDEVRLNPADDKSLIVTGDFNLSGGFYQATLIF